MEAKQRVAVTFAIYQNQQLVRRETVSQDVIKIGSDPKSHLRIDDATASRMHAVLQANAPDQLELMDLGYEPGTLVNGTRVNKTMVRLNDQITIGATVVVVEKAELVADAGQVPAGNPFAANPFAAAPGAGSNPFAANPFGAPAAAGSSGSFGSSPFGSNPFGAAASFGGPSNPFAAARQDQVAADAPEGTYTYALIKSGPEVASDEVESSSVAGVDVAILWGENILYSSHLSPPRSFVLGEGELGAKNGKATGVDYFMPVERLGTQKLPIVVGGASGVSVVIPPGAKGSIKLQAAGQAPTEVSVEQLVSSGQAPASGEVPGGHQIPLTAGSSATIHFGGFTYKVAAGNGGKKVAGITKLESAPLMFHGASFAVHAGLLAAMAFFMPPLGNTDEDGVSADQQFLIQQYLQAAAEKEQEQKTEQQPDDKADNKEGGTGTKAKGDEGSMGKDTAAAANKRYGVQGPQDNKDPHLAKQAALRDAQEFGMIGLLNSGAGGDPNAPTAPWGRDDSLGNDALSARGNMFGADIGDSFGAGGLGLSGIGEGGGGRGEGVGLGSFGGLGHGAGTGTGQGIGGGHGRLSGSHSAKPPQVRMGATTVSGRLPPEVIQRIVRQNFGRFRLCYDNGLRNNPNLQGRVTVRFVIGRDGSVGSVGNGGSDLPDGGVVSCVVRSFSGLSFPQPEGGIVTVVYPISFTPGG